MPTVPRYARQVGPARLPSGARHAVETPTSAGVGAAEARAALGRGVEEIGGAVSNVGERFLNIAYSAQVKERQEAKDYADQLAILGANNKLDTWERTLYADGGAFTLQGEAALGSPEKVNGEFNKVAGEIEQNLTNPEQQLAFAKMRSQRGQSIALDVERHVSSEIQQFAATELTAAKKNKSDFAILKGGAGDFNGARDAMNTYATAVHTIGKRLGMGPEAMEAEIGQFRSDVHVGIIEQLVADEHPDLATRYYEAVTHRTVDGARVKDAPADAQSEIAGEQLDNVTKLLKQGNAKKDAQDLRDQVQAEGGTLQEQREKVKARSSGDVEDMALDYIEHDHTVAKGIERERSEAASTNMVNILERTRGNLRAIQGLPEWTDLQREERAGLRRYAESLQEGTGPSTDWKAYYGARTLALDDPEAFAALDLYKLYRGKLANAQFEQLLDIRQAIRSKDDTKTAKLLGGVSTDTQIWNSVVKAPGSGIAEDTDAARALRTRWEQMVQAEQEASGKELDVTKKRQFLDDLVMDAAITKGTGWAIVRPFTYDFWDQPKKGYQITLDDIPKAEQEQIKEGLRNAKPPIPVTDVNMLRAYLRDKRPK